MQLHHNKADSEHNQVNTQAENKERICRERLQMFSGWPEQSESVCSLRSLALCVSPLTSEN